MKITEITANSRKRSFATVANGVEYVFPYAKRQLQPTKDDPVDEVFADPELGHEVFTHRLRSGADDSVHLDEVREFAQVQTIYRSSCSTT